MSLGSWILMVVLNGIPHPVQSYSDQLNCESAAFEIEATNVNAEAYCLQQEI